MPMQPGDLLPVSRAGVPYKATQRDVLGNRLWVDGEVVNDANDATANGWYRAAAGAANLPLTTNLNIQVVSYVPGVWTLQTAHALALLSATDSATWIRWQAAGAWQPWQKLALLPTEQTGTGGGGGPEYVLRAGDRMSGQLASSVTGGWAFVGNSIPGTNDSGLYCDGDNNYIFALRDKTGAITVDINSNGDAVLSALLLQDLAGATPAPLAVDVDGLLVRGTAPDLTRYVNKTGDTMIGSLTVATGDININTNTFINNRTTEGWAFLSNGAGLFRRNNGSHALYADYCELGDAINTEAAVIRNLTGPGAGVVLVDGNGSLYRGPLFDPTEYVSKTGDRMSGSLTSSTKDGWVFVGNSIPGKNDSGLYCDFDDNYIFSLRDKTGGITVVINNLGDARLGSLLLQDLAGATPAPLAVDVDGLLVRGTAPDLTRYVNKTGDTMTGSLTVATGDININSNTFINNRTTEGWAFLSNGAGLFRRNDGSHGLYADYCELGDAINTEAAVIRNLTGPGAGVVLVDGNGSLYRGPLVDPTEYVSKAGDRMSGPLSSSVTGNWAFIANSIPGVNDSGLYCENDGESIFWLRDKTGAVKVDINSLGDARLSSLLLQDLAGATPAPLAVDVDGLLVRGTAPDLTRYVNKTGDTMTGSLTVATGDINVNSNTFINNRNTEGWAFLSNGSGLFRRDNGSHALYADYCELGDAINTEAAVIRNLTGPGAGVVLVDGNGSLYRGPLFDPTEYVSKTGDRMSGSLSSSVKGNWAFVANSNPGVNDSGLYCENDGESIFWLRDKTGVLNVDINSLGDARISSLLLRDLAGADSAPLRVAADGLLVRGSDPDLTRYVNKTGDTMTGSLTIATGDININSNTFINNRTTEGWAFLSNGAGLFRRNDGSYGLYADYCELGDAINTEAAVIRNLTGPGAGVVLVDGNGSLYRGPLFDPTEYVSKTGDRMSGSLSSSVKGNWAFVANSNPGVNDSGLYCENDGESIFWLRDKTGAVKVDINSLGDARISSLLLRDLAGATPAPLRVAADGLLVRGNDPDLSGFVNRTGDRMSGVLSSSVKGNWAFIANSIPGTNDSGLYCEDDGDSIFWLRDKAGAVGVELNANGTGKVLNLQVQDKVTTQNLTVKEPIQAELGINFGILPKLI